MSEVFKTAQSSEVVATPQEIGPVQPEAKEISSENQSTPQDIERLDLFEGLINTSKKLCKKRTTTILQHFTKTLFQKWKAKSAHEFSHHRKDFKKSSII